MSDQQPLSRAQSAYPYNRPLPQHHSYGPGNGPPLPPPPHNGRIHHHAYTDSALMAGAPGPLSAAGYPVSANPAYQPLSYNQAPYSNGVSANPPPQQYGGPPLQPPPGPVHSRSDGAVPAMSGGPPPPSPYWAGPAQAVGPGGPGPYSPPPGAQPPHNNPSSPTGSSPRQSFGSYQEYAPRHPGLPPLPQKEYTAPVGPQSAAPPYGFHVPPALPPLPPKIMLPTPPAVPQSDPMQFNGEQQQQQQFQQQPMQSSPTSMAQELAPNGGLQPGDDELDRALRLSMESFAAENQRHDPAAEDEEARILRESREEYERQQERNRMVMSANDESEEEMMARVMAMSLAEEVNKQKQIERQIQRSSRDNMPGPSGSSSRPSFDGESELPYRTSGLTHSASTSSRSSVGRTHTPRPHIVTSISDPLGSRSPTPNPSQMQQSSFQSPTHTQPPNPRSPTSPNSPNSMDMLPQYEEVASSPQRRVGQPHLSPIPTTPGLTASPSSVPQSGVLESPGLQLPHSMSEPTMSPIGLSPGGQVSPSLSPHQMAQGLQGSPPQRHRPHSSTLPSTSNGGGSGLHRGSSSPSTGAILNQQAQHQLPQGAPVLRTSRSSTQLANRPHTMQGDGQNVPPVPPMPMPMPVPSIPNGLAAPRPATANADLRGRLSPQPPTAGPPPANMNGAGPSTSTGAKRIQMEAEYSNKVSFGYMPPPLDQPVIPPCPAFPETVVIQADAAFHISAPTWHHLMKLLARLGEAKVVPSPAAFSSMPLTTTAADLRLILHFHKNKMGGEWRVVLWLDYDRALPKSMTPNERGRWTNGDTTLLPWGCRVPEESISGPLRGPGPMEVSTSTGNFVYVLQGPFPKLPISLSNVAAILQETYQKSKQSSSTGVPSSSESGAPQVDKGLSLKRLSKAVDKIYPPSKRGTSVASGVLKRPESGDLVAVGGKRTMGEWFKSGFGKMVGAKEEKGGQYKNEEELADLVTPFSLDGR